MANETTRPASERAEIETPFLQRKAGEEDREFMTRFSPPTQEGTEEVQKFREAGDQEAPGSGPQDGITSEPSQAPSFGETVKGVASKFGQAKEATLQAGAKFGQRTVAPALSQVGETTGDVVGAIRKGAGALGGAVGLNPSDVEQGLAPVEFAAGVPTPEEQKGPSKGIMALLAAIPGLGVLARGGKLFSKADEAIKLVDDLDRNFFFHGTDAAGAKALRETGVIGEKEGQFVTDFRSMADAFASRKGGEVFAIRKSDLPEDALDELGRLKPGVKVQARPVADVAQELAPLRQARIEPSPAIRKALAEQNLATAENAIDPFYRDGVAVYNLKTGHVAKEHGYSVDAFPEMTFEMQGPATPQDVADYLGKLQSAGIDLNLDDLALSVSYDTFRGMTEMKVVAVTDDLGRAVANAKELGRSEVLNLRDMRTTHVEKFGENVAPVRSTIKDIALAEQGRVSPSALAAATRAVLGATAGGVIGEDSEDKIAFALIGAGLGTIATPKNVKRIIEAFRRRSGPTKINPKAKLTDAERATPLSDIAKRFRQGVQDQRRGRRTFKQAKEEGHENIVRGGETLEGALETKPGTAFNDNELAALGEIYQVEGEKLRGFARRVMDTSGGEAEVDTFLTQLATVGRLEEVARGATAEAGRSLNFIKALDDDILAYRRRFSSVFNKMRASQDPTRMAEMIAALDDPEAIRTTVKHWTSPGLTDMLLEGWINGLLSGFKTSTTNLTSGVWTLTSSVGERALARWLPGGAPVKFGADKGFPGGSNVVPGEAMAMVRGYVSSFSDAWEMAYRSFKDDIPRFGQSKLEARPTAITGQNVSNLLARVNVTSKELPKFLMGGIDMLGTFVRLPGRFLMAQDEFMKAIAYRGELNALAHREAYSQVLGEGLKGRQFSKRVRDLEKRIVSDPAELSFELQKNAQDFASYVTFTNELGEVGQSLQQIAKHPVGRIVMPFVRTPLNIFKYANERTPLGLVTTKFWDDMQKGGAARQLALSKLSMGSGTMATAAMLASAGIITGSGPDRPEVKSIWRTSGRQPYSVNVSQLKRMSTSGEFSPPQEGDEWVSFVRTDPIGMLLGLAADWQDIAGHLDEETADEIGTKIVVALSQNMTSKTYVKGVAETLHWLSEPDRARNPFKNLTRSVVPAGVRQIEQELDPTVREVRTLLDEIKAGIPGWSKDLPPVRNFWGEPVVLGGGLGPDIISPFYRSEFIDDPVVEELVKINIPLDAPDERIGNVTLDPQRADKLRVIFGTGKLLGGKTIHKQLQSLIESPLYQSEDPAFRRDPQSTAHALIRQRVNLYKKVAEVKLILEDKELRDTINLSQRINALARTPSGRKALKELGVINEGGRQPVDIGDLTIE